MGLAWVVLLVVAQSPAPDAGVAPPGCSALADAFCTDLFSPAHNGNWDVPFQGQVLRVRQGLTENDFPPPFFRAMELRAENAAHLPVTVRRELERFGFFEKLRHLLAMPPVASSTPEALLRRQALLPELDTLWTSAIRIAAARQMEERHPGYLRTLAKERSPAWKEEERDLRKALARGAYRATWEPSPEWKELQAEFERVRKTMKAWLAERAASLSPALYAAHVEDLDRLTLVPPGAGERLRAGCATHVVNASYNYTLNLIEVCAGLLGDPARTVTLAHEMGHALGVARQRHRWLSRWPGTQKLEDLQSGFCTRRTVSCEGWEAQKAILKGAPKLPAVGPAEVLQCLQERTLKPPRPEAVRAVAARVARASVRSQASRSTFLALTREQVPTPSNAHHPNPRYLNPCDASEDEPEDVPFYPPKSLQLMFLAEYQCSKEKDPVKRLVGAIEGAQAPYAAVTVPYLGFGGPFAVSDSLIAEGYAESVEEHFADLVAGSVVARLVAEVPEVEARRTLVFAMLARRCEQPSWEREFPAEARAVARFSARTHALDSDRRDRFFGPRIQALLACRQDADAKACSWEP